MRKALVRSWHAARHRLLLRVTGFFSPWWERRVVRRLALSALIRQTNNFANVTWLGRPVWQNIADAWTIQQTIIEKDVDLVVECGTNQGGSAYFIATIFDLLGRGRVITIDIERMADLTHPRIDFLVGSSTDEEIFRDVRRRLDALEPANILVLLDSDHSAGHVLQELEMYSSLLRPGELVLVQDGCIDELALLGPDRPGPLRAIEHFLRGNRAFQVDEERSNRFLLSHSPKGWLRRVS